MSCSKATLASVVAVAALGLGACGGDDEETTTATTTSEAGAATGATGAAEEGTGAAVASAIQDDNKKITVAQCPEPVTLEAGEEFDCDFTAEEKGQEVSGTMTVTVDSADDESATVNYKAKGKPTEPGPIKSLTLFGYDVEVAK